MCGGKLRFAAAGALLLALGCSASSSSNNNPFAQGGAGGADQYGTGGTGNGGSSYNAGGTTSVTGNGGHQGTTLFDAGTGPYPYDLNTTFSWPTTSAEGGIGGRCKAGHYVGTYSCEVTNADAGVYSLTGPVDLQLSEAQSGEFLTVSGGELKSAAGILAMDATVVGQLNCQSGAFSGNLPHGSLALVPFPPAPDSFDGTMQASFVSSGPALSGTWTLFGEGTFQGYVCHGPWTAKWQPN